jgi:hypothetical protein
MRKASDIHFIGEGLKVCIVHRDQNWGVKYELNDSIFQK